VAEGSQGTGGGASGGGNPPSHVITSGSFTVGVDAAVRAFFTLVAAPALRFPCPMMLGSRVELAVVVDWLVLCSFCLTEIWPRAVSSVLPTGVGFSLLTPQEPRPLAAARLKSGTKTKQESREFFKLNPPLLFDY
jgi:hypothetical protein